MHPDDLKTIWQCSECGRGFIYHSDVVDHELEYHHLKIISRDLHTSTVASIFIRRKLSIRFKIEGRIATLTIDCKYYPSRQAIVYADVRYSSKKLQATIEGKPSMMRNIDNYLRKLLETETVSGGASTEL